jgi:endonuclease YncB( thermonuclease family)
VETDGQASRPDTRGDRTLTHVSCLWAPTVALALSLLFATPVQAQPVTRVVDGDTIIVEGVGRVRLIGVDTPETVDPRRPVESFGTRPEPATC